MLSKRAHILPVKDQNYVLELEAIHSDSIYRRSSDSISYRDHLPPYYSTETTHMFPYVEIYRVGSPPRESLTPSG